MMIALGTATKYGCDTPFVANEHNKTNAHATINLSATGSKKAPKAEDWFHFLAKYPSNQSVIAAKTNTKQHPGADHAVV
jgi:hypothetical protein